MMNYLSVYIGTWKKNGLGDSLSGSTATCALFRNRMLYVANVGDSTAVLGKINPRCGQIGQPKIIPEIITDDHKPDDKSERERIEALGGMIYKNKRVVWECRTEKDNKVLIDKIPLLNMTRSLGDLWSITSSNQYLISPVPDVYTYCIDPSQDLFIVLASDGLWNVMSAQKVVKQIYEAGHARIDEAAYALICQALRKYKKHGQKADNISLIICMFSKKLETQSAVESLHEVAPYSSTSSLQEGSCIVPELDSVYQYQDYHEEQMFYS